MKITAITATYQRPDAFALCQKYMARQTRQPDQWLILDGPDPMREKVLNAFTSGSVSGDAVVVYEDDDYYFPTWIEWCEKRLARYEIVGQGNALYYNVARRWWSECRNTRHASLCTTAITQELFEPLCNCIRSFDNQFFDTKLWRIDCNRYLQIPKDGERLVIGMKGLTGTQGYSNEHKLKTPKDVHLDPALMYLWKQIGEDAASYSKFKR